MELSLRCYGRELISRGFECFVRLIFVIGPVNILKSIPSEMLKFEAVRFQSLSLTNLEL